MASEPEFLGIYYLYSSVISFTISLTFNYIASIKWVFDVSKKQTKSPKEKLLKLEEIIQKVKDIINNPIYKEAIIKIKNELINLLKAIIPYKLFFKARFSTGSPDTTGIALGILAMFPIGYQNRWKIEPDFESDNAFIDSSFDIKGKIYFYKVLAIAIRLLIDKNCRKLYNDIRRLRRK